MEEERSLLVNVDGNGLPQRYLLHNEVVSQHLFHHPFLTAYHVFTHILLLLLLILFIFQVFEDDQALDSPPKFLSASSLRLVTKSAQMTSHSEHSMFSGPPSAKSDDSWARLIQPIYMNASSEELGNAGVDYSGAVRYGSGGYMASLGIYHDLHCLRKLRHYLYRQHYLPSMSGEALESFREHLDHCIDMIRVSLMCTPDLSLYTFEWPSDKEAEFLDSVSSSSRTCVDWGQLATFTIERVVLEPELLKPKAPQLE